MSDPERNRYAPPAADIGSGPPLLRPSMPPPIAQSLALTAAAIGVWVLLFILDTRAVQGRHPWGYYVDALLPLLILEAWLAFEIRSGANWARFAQAVVVVLACFAMIPGLVELAQSDRLLASVELVDLFLAAASLYLLFGPGRFWFSVRPARAHDMPRPPRPRSLVIAVVLIAVAAAMPPLFWAWTLVEDGVPEIGMSTGVGIIVRVAIPAMLCVKLLEGHRWARTVFIVLALFGFLQVCYLIGVGHRTLGDEWRLMLPIFLVRQGLPAALGLVAVHLLYFSSAAWFNRRSPVET